MYHTHATPWPDGKPPAEAYCDEDQRLAILAAHGTDAMVDDPELQGIASLAARICHAPMAMVTLVEEERQLFLARTGLEARETPRSTSFCAHAMLGAESLVVRDAREDARFADNPLVTGEPHIRFYAGQPLVSAEGAPLGALCVIDTAPRADGLTDIQRETLVVLAKSVMRRISQQRLGATAEKAVNLRENYLQRMIDSVPGIAWSADAAGNFDYINPQWTELTGLPAPRTLTDWQAAVHPEDWENAAGAFQRALDSDTPFEYEWRLKLADGEYRWMLSRAVKSPVGNGETRWFGTVIEIDRQRRLSEARDLLANELSHRIKNIFAVVSGLIAIRARGKPEVAEFAEALNQAIRALSAAHNHVRPGNAESPGTLSGLLADLLAPYGSARDGRFSIGGPGIAISPRAATPLALIFHELATNSAKYGALSCVEGHVTILVEEAGPDGNEIRVAWDESARSCDIPEAGEHEGFGSRLLRMAVEGQLGGTFERRHSEDGLSVTITVPRTSIES